MRLTLYLLAIVSLAIVSCVSTRPMHYYTLEPASAPASQGTPDGPTILVGIIETPEVLQDERIRYRAGANQAGAYEYHRWTERPGAMVRDSLMHALRASGKYQRVIESSSSSAIGDYLVSGKLYELDEVDNAAIQTRIRLRIQLVDKKSGRIAWDRVIVREEPVSARNVPDVVASLDRNLQQVVSQVATGIEGFLAR
jgi:cholesterol transport system auxiliary component